MTLTGALHALHAAGRIRSPFLGGMLVDHHVAQCRVTIRLSTAHVVQAVPADAAVERHLTDPATVGCLLALLREASGDPWLLPSFGYRDPAGSKWDDEEMHWFVRLDNETWPDGLTEAEAIAAALIALAEVTRG